MPATIRDVARIAGVSVTAAHRALNGKAELSSDKRARVLEAARELNYVPSAAARALVSGKTNTIGMVVTDNSSPVYAGVVRGVEEITNAAGFGLLLCNSGDSQERAISCLETLRAKQVDGVLITPVQTDRRDIAHLHETATPYVLLMRHFAEIDSDYVITDNETGGYEATVHLLDLGHTRIGHVAGPACVSSAQGRMAGYRRALTERGISIPEDLIAHAPFTIGGGYDASLALLDRPNRPSAIFASNDLQAVGVMKAARALDLKIPDDLALVGGDDIELAEFLEVPLTTFHQPLREIGSLGAEILIERLRDESEEKRRVVLTPRLIVRRSSGWQR
jgi:LacI family transcriptional regulator